MGDRRSSFDDPVVLAATAAAFRRARELRLAEEALDAENEDAA